MKASDAKLLSDAWRLRCNFDQEFFDRLKNRMYEFIEAKAKIGEIEMTFSFYEIIKEFGNDLPHMNLNECNLYQKKLEEDLVGNGYRVSKDNRIVYTDTKVAWGHNILGF